MKEKIISKVWHIPKLFGNVIPGALVYNNGSVAFITEKGVVFNVTLSEMKNVKWPFLRMGLGFDAVVQENKYKFSFSKPNPNAPDVNLIPGSPLPSVSSTAQYSDDLSSLATLKTDKATARLWKDLFNSVLP